MPETCRGGAVAIGNFDGVHRGHARLAERLVRHAREIPGPAVVFTFEPHPVRLLRPHLAPPPLTWTERKALLLGELGVDALVAYPTDEALLSLRPDEFFQRIVIECLAARVLVEGPNFFFGRDRSGNVETLQRLCTAAGCELEVVEPVVRGDTTISSSRIRQLLAAGRVDEATEMLTRPYRIRGLVTHGARRGSQLGFPTANLDAVDTLIPSEGVYAGWGHTVAGRWPAAINIGPNPTFQERAMKLEVHLIGFSGSLYGEPLEVDFLARLRDIQTFAGVDQLKLQLQADLAATLSTCQSRPSR